MNKDSIVEEIHQIRGKMLSECNEDLDRLLDRYKLAEREDQARLVPKETALHVIGKTKTP